VENDGERVNKRSKEWHRTQKRIVYDHYSPGIHKCACCGEDNIEFLSLDHIHNDGASHRKKVPMSQIYTWLIKNNFPDGFQILCMNCNFTKGIYGKCPHIKEAV